MNRNKCLKVKNGKLRNRFNSENRNLPPRCRRRTAKPDLASLPVEAAELQPRRGWPITTHTPHTLQPCHVPQADSKPRSIRTIPQTTASKQGEIAQADGAG